MLALPPLEDQAAILTHVWETTAPIQLAIGRAQREVSLLREYRARLIADVVTGKLDVREAAASLPEEADAPDLPDDTEVDAEVDDDEAGGDLDAAAEEVDA